MGAAERPELDYVNDADRAAVLMHPLRLRILAEADEPRSPATIGERLGLPRQKVHYHVQALARAGFLRKAGRRRKRNMTEQRWVATARHYALAPQLLGVLGADRGTFEDAFSVQALIGLLARAQADVGTMHAQAAEEGTRLATLSLTADFRFESPLQRAAFTQSLQEALAEVIARHSVPMNDRFGEPNPGRPFRLVLGCFPTPRHDPPPAGAPPQESSP